jgi:hypothetical protein
VFSPLIAFTGVFHNLSGTYVEVETDHAKKLKLSPIHLLLASVSMHDKPTHVQARELVVGWFVWVVQDEQAIKPSRITRLSEGTASTWYTPLTEVGTVVVDGVVTSCHTTGPHELVRAIYLPWRWWLYYFPQPQGELPSSTEFPFFTRVLRQGVAGKAMEAVLLSMGGGEQWK